MGIVQAEAGSALYPPLELPHPEALTDADAYLIQRQRMVAHKLENLYQSWDVDQAVVGKGAQDAAPLALVHVTLPEPSAAQKSEVFVPEELQSNSLSGGRTGAAALQQQRGIMQPRAFENVFKSLEAQEQKVAGDKAKNAAQEHDDADMEENEEDLVRSRVWLLAVMVNERGDSPLGCSEQGDDMNDYTFDYYDSDAGSDEGDEEVFF